MFTTARIVATNVAEAGSAGKFDETDFACLEWSVMGRVHSYFAGKLGDIELEMMLELGLMRFEHGRGEMDAQATVPTTITRYSRQSPIINCSATKFDANEMEPAWIFITETSPPPRENRRFISSINNFNNVSLPLPPFHPLQ
jgi:hypothetical protein